MTVFYLFRDTEDGSACLDFFLTEQAAEQALLTEAYTQGCVINEQVQKLPIVDPTGLCFDSTLPAQDTTGLVPVWFMLHAHGDGTLSAEFFQSEDAWMDAWQAEDGIINESDQVFHVVDPTGILFADKTPGITPSQSRGLGARRN